MDTGVIYVISSKTSGKKYVGQAVSFTQSGKQWGSWRRWQAHVQNAKRNTCECRLLENAIQKYGEKDFIVEDVLICGIKELNDYEREYIEEYQTLAPKGYNLMTGGGNGRVHSEDTRQKMSITRFGKIHTELTRQRIGEGNKGLIIDKKGRENIGKASKYRNMSDDNKERLKDALDQIGIVDLPIYVVLSVDRRYNRNVDVIQVRNPDYPNKKFGEKNMPLVDKIRLAISYTQRSSV